MQWFVAIYNDFGHTSGHKNEYIIISQTLSNTM